jgi:probable addiction module antidote protein
MQLKNFSDTVMEQLTDPEFAMAYLQVSLEEEGISGLLAALGKYVKANGGIKRTAEEAQLRREAVYRMLSENGNPEIRSLDALLRVNGFQLSLTRAKTHL